MVFPAREIFKLAASEALAFATSAEEFDRLVSESRVSIVAIFISRRDYQHAKADDLGPVHNPLRRLRPQVLIPITWR